jgi:hypothetical protein
VRFGWQGFGLEHPDEWAPVALAGARSEGYVRISGPGPRGLQVRWKSARDPGDLAPRLERYFSRLRRDAARANHAFSHQIDPGREGLDYSYSGVGSGRGRMFYSPSCSRVFVLEAMSSKKDSLLPLVRGATSTFRSYGEAERELWALLGIEASLPSGLIVERKAFLAGRTELALRGRGVRVRVDRWGFAEQLLSRHGFEPWVRATLGASVAGDVREEESGLRALGRRGPLRRKVETLARHLPESNQILLLSVEGGGERWRPLWDWLP